MSLIDKLSLDFEIKLTDSKHADTIIVEIFDDNPLLEFVDKHDIAWVACSEKER